MTFAGTEFTASGLVNGDTVTGVTLTSAGAAATATVAGGPYDIVASDALGTGLGNYTIAYHTGTLSVAGKTLHVLVSSQTKTYGDTETFTRQDVTIVGLVNGDTVTGITLTSAGAAATATVAGSPYAIVASDAVGTGLGNYAIIYHTAGTLSVTPKALDVTATDRTKTYGDTVTFAGTEFTTNGLVNGDTVTGVTLTSAGAAATATVALSPYDIDAGSAVGSGLANYTITYHTGTLSVAGKTLHVLVSAQTKTYGDTETFTRQDVTIAGLINGDTVTGVTLTSAGAAATATVAGVPYNIVSSDAVGTGLDNYMVVYHAGKLSVTPKALDVTATDRTKTYGDTVTFAGTEFTTNGLVNGDTVTGVTLTSAGAAATATVAARPMTSSPAARWAQGSPTTRSPTTPARCRLPVRP